MKTLLLTLFACGLVAAADPKAEKELLGATEAFREAYLKKDTAALAKMAHEDLIYIHSSGTRETKAEFLKAFAGGARFDITDTVVRADGNLGVVAFKVDLRSLAAPDRPNPLMLMMTWAKSRDGWKLIGRQAARVPEPAAGQKK